MIAGGRKVRPRDDLLPAFHNTSLAYIRPGRKATLPTP
jgi:hypothetical protein